MNTKYITQFESDEHFLMIPLGTKNYDKAIAKGEDMVNQLLNGIGGFEELQKHLPKCRKSPKTVKDMNKIARKLWKILK